MLSILDMTVMSLVVDVTDKFIKTPLNVFKRGENLLQNGDTALFI